MIEDEGLVTMHLEQVLAECGTASLDFADTEAEAVATALRDPPGLITSNVRLREGLGPRAVAAIPGERGPLPVTFITATPERCEPCEPPTRVFGKPPDERGLVRAFRELVPG